MSNPQTDERTFREKAVDSPLTILLGFVVLIWILEFMDWAFLDGALDTFGIVPRQISGLRGVVLAPFLHDGYTHLAANTVPLIVLGALITLRHQWRLVLIAVIIVLVSGLGTWLIASGGTIHFGASGLIFGFVGFLIADAWYEKSAPAVFMAILVIALYGGVLWGIFPQGNGISWQGHLFGFAGGILAAYIFSKEGTTD